MRRKHGQEKVAPQHHENVVWQHKWSVLFLLSLLVLGLLELSMGRTPWSIDGSRCLLAKDPTVKPNSQCMVDHWTPGHVEQGMFFYLLLSIFRRHDSWPKKIGLCVLLEFLWELCENTNYMIARYRSAGYLGDSLANSLTDCIACLYGFMIAIQLKPKWTLATIVAWEIISFWWFRDNGLRNVLRLGFPDIDSLQPP
jgi:hypothetical protein